MSFAEHIVPWATSHHRRRRLGLKAAFLCVAPEVCSGKWTLSGTFVIS